MFYSNGNYSVQKKY